MINVHKISKKYDNTIALDNINLTIPKGSIFGLLGPNGSGKTTLIRILTGIIVADSGQILMNGQALNKLSVKEIGYLPEERGLYKKMRVGEQAVYLAALKGLNNEEAEKRVKKWLEKFNISNCWNKKTDTLSKGMQQKVQFIISAIHYPDALILDEPFSGLDPINREILSNQILELNKSGTTIILSTHDMSSVEQLCDQVALFNKGKILLSGKINEIRQAEKSFLYEFCFKRNDTLLVNECNNVDAKIISIEKNDNGFSLKVQFKDEQEAEFVLTNVLMHIGLTSFLEILPSIQDIFVESVTNNDNVNQ